MQYQYHDYEGRTEFFHNNISSGSVALRLHHIRSSDEGKYRCSFASVTDRQEAEFQVYVTGTGSAPHIYIEEDGNKNFRLVCTSTGWYPEPEVQWMKNQENLLSSGTMIKKKENGLFSVETSISVSANSKDHISCSIWNPFLSQELEASVSLADGLCPNDLSWMVTSIVTMVLLSIAVFILIFQNRKLKKVKGLSPAPRCFCCMLPVKFALILDSGRKCNACKRDDETANIKKSKVQGTIENLTKHREEEDRRKAVEEKAKRMAREKEEQEEARRKLEEQLRTKKQTPSPPPSPQQPTEERPPTSPVCEDVASYEAEPGYKDHGTTYSGLEQESEYTAVQSDCQETVNQQEPGAIYKTTELMAPNQEEENTYDEHENALGITATALSDHQAANIKKSKVQGTIENLIKHREEEDQRKAEAERAKRMAREKEEQEEARRKLEEQLRTKKQTPSPPPSPQQPTEERPPTSPVCEDVASYEAEPGYKDHGTTYSGLEQESEYTAVQSDCQETVNQQEPGAIYKTTELMAPNQEAGDN
ncbi:butyrophilin-like protein 1 [Dromiciops gliroides]|uniref:butyrophilin-like protein 1 n=1 Tax=Dromiciops gliroides TaxID=33562 RepID=UPI001CC44571|nr:butyrophilin-like protein 1 [Dromiciops gliroides]